MNQEYKLSGKAGNIWATGIVIGAPLAILASIIYSYIVVYNPFIYLTLLVYIGYLFSIIMIQKWVMKLAKCRSKNSFYVYGTLIGLFALYANWCTFLFVLFQRFGEGVPFMDLLLNPSGVLELAKLVSVDGWYSIFKVQVSGGALWAIWVIEAAGILAAGILGGPAAMHEAVFCENCNTYLDDVDFALNLSLSEKEKIDTAIKEDIGLLTEVSLAAKDESPYVKVNIHHCSQCNNTSTVNLDLIRHELDKEGKLEEKNEDLSPVILLTDELYQKFVLKKDEVAKELDQNVTLSTDLN